MRQVPAAADGAGVGEGEEKKAGEEEEQEGDGDGDTNMDAGGSGGGGWGGAHEGGGVAGWCSEDAVSFERRYQFKRVMCRHRCILVRLTTHSYVRVHEHALTHTCARKAALMHTYDPLPPPQHECTHARTHAHTHTQTYT